MTKLLLEIKSNNPKLTVEIINKFLLDKKFDFVWVKSHEDLPRGKREYFSSNRLASNGA
jgi:hypothetical protein